MVDKVSVLNTNQTVYVAGHRGMVGSAIVQRLQKAGVSNIITRTHHELDLTSQSEVNRFFSEQQIDYVVLAAAKVGGVNANNTYPAEFIHENLMMQNNVIDSAYQSGVKRLLFLGSSCIYPKMVSQPMKEDSLLSGYLEPTNEPYALAKIAGIKMCESYNRQYGTHYRSVMPTNLYGPGDNFNIHTSHVVPALLRKAHDAKVENSPFIDVWGSGNSKREFLHVDDMADACLFVMQLDDETVERNTSSMLSHINVGTGMEISITELAEKVCQVVGFEGKLVFNTDMPEGAPRKLLDVSRMTKLGWKAQTNLDDGLAMTYRWFLEHYNSLRS